MEKEIFSELFTTKLDRELIKLVRMYCLDQQPRVKIQEFVSDALRKELKRKKK